MHGPLFVSDARGRGRPAVRLIRTGEPWRGRGFVFVEGVGCFFLSKPGSSPFFSAEAGFWNPSILNILTEGGGILRIPKDS